MAETSRHDAWQAGDHYEAYMGRWSRQIAPLFLDWLDAGSNLDWLDIGCGTGALSATILSKCEPSSLICTDSSEQFVLTARSTISDRRAEFQVGDAQTLSIASGSRDVVVSALLLNFVPDKLRALREMKRVARTGGTVGLYVWDYPGRGAGFLRAFWDAAAALDLVALELAEDKRFSFCTPEALGELMSRAGLVRVYCKPIEILTAFADFEDYWHPFTLGAGPAPGYCANLGSEARQRLKKALDKSLARREDGSIALKSRAWAMKAVA